MADQRVLEAQRWVNATYTAVPGYVPCPEDGRAGRRTRAALTRALQHELGIADLADTFGPATAAALDARGGIGPADDGSHLVRIIQCASACRGYDPGRIDGRWGTAPPDRMLADMGIRRAEGDPVPTALVRALLTTQAHVLRSGGDPEVRRVQQWLNGHYWHRSSGVVVATDGRDDRTVQLALMRALQLECGIPEDRCTGTFGPATRQALRDRPLEPGAQGVLVRFFSALCVLHGPLAAKDGTPLRPALGDDLDDDLVHYLDRFQRFSHLPRTGVVDFATWCQLLVSTGDPDRPATACDTSATITPAIAAELKRRGLDVVGRYLENAPGSTFDKQLRPDELQVILDAGLKVLPIWQHDGRSPGDFSHARGLEHGARAHARMVEHDLDPGAIIYFAVDHDATDAEIDDAVLPYFRGVQKALNDLGRRYRTGVYGSRNVCTRVTNETNAAASFVAGLSSGYSGNLGFALPSNWAFNQIQETTLTVPGGPAIPLVRDVHRRQVDPGVGRSRVGGRSGPSRTDEVCDRLDALWALALAHGGDPNRRVLEYLRSPDYTTSYGGWDLLLGAWDQDWIDHAKASLAGADVPRYFADPTSGERIGIAHLAATANAYYLRGAGGDGSVSRGDFGGWGGDLVTFYGDWRNDASSWASGRAYCADRLARRDVASHFGFGDLVEDADGYLLGMAARSGGSFASLFRAHMTTGHATRFRDLFQGRFGGEVAVAVRTARAMLAGDTGDRAFNLMRDLTYRKVAGPFCTHPRRLGGARLDPFVEGFAERLQALAEVG